VSDGQLPLAMTGTWTLCRPIERTQAITSSSSLPTSPVPAEHGHLGAIRTTTPRTGQSGDITRSYTALSQVVRESGLLRRSRWFYALLTGGLLLALVGAGIGFALLRDSWFLLLIAAGLGIVFTQFAFFAHEASHRQVLTSGKANDRVGRLVGTLLVGMSYSWWMSKHSRHHANPNQVGKDPDIESKGVAFTPEVAAAQRRPISFITRFQAYLLIPLLLLEGLNLHIKSVRSLLKPGRVEGRALELSLIGTRFAIYLSILFVFLPLGMAFAFLGVQLAVFGLYMGASFLPNHTGMPIIPAGSKLDFFAKQVRTSRNIGGGFWASALLGGLNYQVEHHLFPSMARPRLAKAREIVREYCRTLGVPYTETTLGEAYVAVLRYLNTVGSAAPDPFACNALQQLRRT
jgi:fatty acid desaturase